MTPAEWLASHRKMIAEIGEQVFVRRYTGQGPARSKIDVAATARVMGYAPRDIVGTISQGDRRVIMLADTISALLPLTTNDKLVIRGREIAIKSIDDNTRRFAGTLIALEIQAAG